MNSAASLYEFIFDNIQKIILPEELIRIELELSRYELIALLLTDKAQTLRMSMLAQGMGVPMSTATGIIDRLVKQGLLKRENSEEDRRVVTVSVTDKGRVLIEEVQTLFHSFVGRIKRVLGEEEFAQAVKLLQKIIIGLQKADPDCPESSVQPRRGIKIE